MLGKNHVITSFRKNPELTVDVTTVYTDVRIAKAVHADLTELEQTLLSQVIEQRIQKTFSDTLTEFMIEKAAGNYIVR